MNKKANQTFTLFDKSDSCTVVYVFLCVWQALTIEKTIVHSSRIRTFLFCVRSYVFPVNFSFSLFYHIRQFGTWKHIYTFSINLFNKFHIIGAIVVWLAWTLPDLYAIRYVLLLYLRFSISVCSIGYNRLFCEIFYNDWLHSPMIPTLSSKYHMLYQIDSIFLVSFHSLWWPLFAIWHLQILHKYNKINWNI